MTPASPSRHLASPRFRVSDEPRADDEPGGWEATCTQILYGINAHTSRIDELLERVSHQEQAVATLQAERSEAQAEARVAQAQVQAQLQQLAACEGRVHELLAVQQQQQLKLQELQQQLQGQQKQQSKAAAEWSAHVRAEQTMATARQALHDQVQGVDGRLVVLERLRVGERLGDAERALEERAKEVRRGLAELAPTSENARESAARGARVADEAASVAHRLAERAACSV